MSKEAKTKPVVCLRVYKDSGQGLIYNADGTVKNDNQSVKITHDTVEWANYKKYLPSNGFCKVAVEKVIQDDDEIKDISKYKEEVKLAFEGDNKVSLTPEQQKIADLEEKLEALTKGMKAGSGNTGEDTDKLNEARAKYKELFGKNPHHKSSLEKIQSDIAAKENE